MQLSDEADFLQDIRSFIGNASNVTSSKWFYCRYMEVYMRTGPKIVGSAAVVCTTISNVEVKEQYRLQGIYSDFLDFLEANSTNPVYLENTNVGEHHPLYLKRNYVPLSPFGRVDRFIKFPISPETADGP